MTKLRNWIALNVFMRLFMATATPDLAFAVASPVNHYMKQWKKHSEKKQ